MEIYFITYCKAEDKTKYCPVYFKVFKNKKRI